MEYTDGPAPNQKTKILCCECGIAIEPNPSNTCVACLRTQVDITEGIPKQATLHFCRGCDRYQQQAGQWVSCTLESRELLAVCLKKIKGLNKVKLVDAGFVWTEPHSRRVKVKLSIQKEVMNAAILQQSFVVEFVVHHQMCTDCHRVEAKDYWNAVVQVRQKSSNKKTIYYLEQVILKHKSHRQSTRVKEVADGLDFFYASKQDARKFTEFLQTVVPCRCKTSEKLISHDIHSNTFNYKHTFSVEIIPICKDDIVCLPSKVAKQAGNISQICVCQNVTTFLHLIDPRTLQVSDVSCNVYWRSPFSSLCSPKQLTEFMVLQVEQEGVPASAAAASKMAAPTPVWRHLSKKHVMADVWMCRSSEVGLEGRQLHARTHLGHLLKPGDLVMGLDLSNSNLNNVHLETISSPDNIQDVILVKKVFGERGRRNRRRKWKLKRLDAEMEPAGIKDDFCEFMEDLEENPEMRRQNVNIYKDKRKLGAESETDDDEVPQITLEEMLDDLNITDNEAEMDDKME